MSSFKDTTEQISTTALPISPTLFPKAPSINEKSKETSSAESSSEPAPISFSKESKIKKRDKKTIQKETQNIPNEQTAKPVLPQKSLRRSTRRRKAPCWDIEVSKEEADMIMKATKNSIREEKASKSSLCTKILDMKTFYPTEEEFKDPIKYIETLFHDEYWKFGCIKIIPPESFKPEFKFNPSSDKKMPTRYQTLQDLSQGKPFKGNKEGLNYNAFKTMAEEFQNKHYELYKDLPPQQRVEELEKQYWKYVDKSQGERITVQYAADLSPKVFGSASPSDPNDPYSSHPWNLYNMNKLQNSLLQIGSNVEISGVNLPWVYAGMLYSTFCWHYEDLMMYSLNYMHHGEGKMWYTVPPQDRIKFESIFKEKLDILIKEDPNLLHNITAMISPNYFAANGVTVYKTEQKPGEFILTFPESYHSGWSTGFNVAEAVNIMPTSWLKYGQK